MPTYIALIKYNSLITFFAYPLDIVLFAVRRIFELIFLIFFWSLVIKNTNGNLRNIISYFLITGGISEIVMANGLPLGNMLRNYINSGFLTYYLIKPINSILATYSGILGARFLIISVSILNIVAGILISENVTFINLLFFIVSICSAVLISLSFNIFLGLLCLKLYSFGGVNQVLNHIVRILSGSYIPLNFFSSSFKNILFLLPFPYAVGFPALVLTQKNIDIVIFEQIFLGLFWGLFLNLFLNYLWKKGLKSYESLGI